MDMTREIKTAAQWWADQLRAPAHHDNGDGFQSVFIQYAASRVDTPLTTAQVDAFAAALRQRMAAYFQEHERLTVGVDYGPDDILEEAAEDAGFTPGMRFPVKTVMWIEQGEVEVSAGYRAPIEALPLMEGAEQ